MTAGRARAAGLAKNQEPGGCSFAVGAWPPDNVWGRSDAAGKGSFEIETSKIQVDGRLFQIRRAQAPADLFSLRWGQRTGIQTLVGFFARFYGVVRRPVTGPVLPFYRA